MYKSAHRENIGNKGLIHLWLLSNNSLLFEFLQLPFSLFSCLLQVERQLHFALTASIALLHKQCSRTENSLPLLLPVGTCSGGCLHQPSLRHGSTVHRWTGQSPGANPFQARSQLTVPTQNPVPTLEQGWGTASTK